MLFQFALLLYFFDVACSDVPAKNNTNGQKTDVKHYVKDKLYDQLQMRFRWPEGLVPYTFVDTHDWLETCVRNAMKTIENVSCIRFVPYNKKVHGSIGYLSIGTNRNGCKSYVGRVPGKGSPFLLAPACCDKQGTVLHELMHTLGFLHEHSRPDRKNYVDINRNNVAKEHWKNFNKEEFWLRIPINTMYDYDSVMHYSPHAFSKNGGVVIKARNNRTIGQRDHLSILDIYKINALYQCKSFLQCYDNLELNDCTEQGLVMKKCADEDWGYANCKQTCGFCRPFQKPHRKYENCIDFSPMCPWWVKQDLCEKRKLVKQWCQKSCRRCRHRQMR
ncbi:Zinc metalloproteinase nas-14 [Trichinella nelsoni]|uniref:Metalloendopeptidase n=1 Tax=Trichinella nelsoni TaxID=6336 RepID=A0A0V0RQM6_9BILA|nr:Zinc metalloproteinase nas-14 [Trichinella nelsoni]